MKTYDITKTNRSTENEQTKCQAYTTEIKIIIIYYFVVFVGVAAGSTATYIYTYDTIRYCLLNVL